MNPNDRYLMLVYVGFVVFSLALALMGVLMGEM